MAQKDYSLDIRYLENSLPSYGHRFDEISSQDLTTLNKAYSLYANYCQSLLGYELDPRIVDVRSFHQYVNPSEIGALISKLQDLNDEEEEETKKTTKKTEEKEEETAEPETEKASIPPDLESLVGEYRQNQALLSEENIKSNRQLSVAKQVEIAIAHSKIKNLALQNRQLRSEKENFLDTEETLVTLGSPKSETITKALAPSYKAIQEVAFTYEAFEDLSPEIQNQIITQAVELNTVSVTNIDVALQTASLLIDKSDFSPEDQKKLSQISTGYVQSVYEAVNHQTQQSANFEAQIAENEIVLLQLKSEAVSLTGDALATKNLQIQSLDNLNQRLQKKIDHLPQQLNTFINNQTVDFTKFEEESHSRLSKNPDTIDYIEVANQNVASIQQKLEDNGVKPHIYTPLDRVSLLEEAIRHDMPGVLLPHAGFAAEETATILNDPKIQTPNLSPQSVLLSGKGLTQEILSQATSFAQENPDSLLGQLYKKEPEIFSSLSKQLRTITSSPLGEQIISKPSLIQKISGSVTKFVGKITDKIPKSIRKFTNVISDPIGAARSWAGRKAGEYVLRQITNKLANDTLKKGGEMLLKDGLKTTVNKLAEKAALKVAAKLGLQVAASSTGIGIVVAIAMEIVSSILSKISSAIKNASVSVYGEEVKARDLVAAPAMAVTGAVSGVVSIIAALGTATVVAAGSATVILAVGAVIAAFFYITSIAVAPLISTLVTLDSTTSTVYRGPILPGCPSTWPVGPGFVLTQGPGGMGSHYNSGYDQAIDIGTPLGTPIISTTYGKVSFAGFSSAYLNTNIVIVDSLLESGASFKVVYAHLLSMDVNVGDSVEIGSSIGTSGTAGTGPHLHYEYKGLLYNQCPAGGVQLAEDCPAGQLYPSEKTCSSTPQVYTK